MTRIKFRGICNEPCSLSKGKYIYGESLMQFPNGNARIGGRLLAWQDVEPDSVTQLVGVDSNGKEVYEGDTLLDENGNPFIVELKPHGCKYQINGERRDYSAVMFEMTERNAIEHFAKGGD